MKKIFLIVFSMLLSLSFVDSASARDVSSCSNLDVKSECNSSRESSTHNACSWNNSTKKCEVTNRKNEALERNNSGSKSSVSNCAEIKSPEACKTGETANGKYACVWNDKYDFCSPTGLAYLSCGEGNEDAHDIPVIIPRLTSYGITILKTVTPVILIIMGMFQMVKAITSQNEDEIKKTTSALIKKLLAAAMVFFIISIVQFIIKQTADSSEEGSASQCLSCFVNNDCNGSMYYTDGYGKCYYLSSKGNGKTCNTDIGGA